MKKHLKTSDEVLLNLGKMKRKENYEKKHKIVDRDKEKAMKKKKLKSMISVFL